MYPQLPSDCLDVIFEHLEDEMDLRSCLLVDRSWCKLPRKYRSRGFGWDHVIGSDRQIFTKTISRNKNMVHGLPNPSTWLFLEKLEPVLTSWANRIPLNPLTLIIECSRSDWYEKENTLAVKDFVRSGVGKNFEVIVRKENYGVLRQYLVD